MNPPNRLRRNLIVAILILGGGWLGVLAWHAAGLYANLRSLQTAAEGEPGRAQVAQAAAPLHSAARHAQALRWGLAPLFPAFDLLEWLPGAGKYLGQAEEMLIYGSGLLQAADEAMQGLGPLFADSSAGDAPLARRVVSALAKNRAHFAAASAAVAGAAQARRELDLNLLPGRAGERLRALDARFPLLQGGLSLLAALPELAGAASPRTYLIVAQNHDELRATGGFISSFGLLEVQGGSITRFEMQDSYAVDNFAAGYPPPPGPIAEYMLAGYWVPRDANWSPDFPTAARDIMSLYTASTGMRVDGVIAFDQTALEQILEALGPVSVPSANEPVSAGNVIAWMQRAWAPGEAEGVTDEWWERRKDFMGELGTAIKDRLMSLDDPAAAGQAAFAALQSVQAGHILLHFEEPAAQSALAQAGLDGAVRPGAGDFLMLVDSNVGFNKADASIVRSIEYRIDLSDPQNPRAAVTLAYFNNAAPQIVCKHAAEYGQTFGNTYYDLTQRCYWDYWRLLAAGDSRLTAGQAESVPAERLLSGRAYSGQVSQTSAEGGTTEFAGLLVLPGGQSQAVRLEWQLPRRVLRQSGRGYAYDLRVQKQPGLSSVQFGLTVIPPAGTALQPPSGWQPGQRGWKGSLDEPLEFHLEFR